MDLITNICNTDLLEGTLSFSVIEAGPKGAIFKTTSVFIKIAAFQMFMPSQ